MLINRLPSTIGRLSLVLAISSGIVIGLLGLATYGLVHEELEQQINQRIGLEVKALLIHHQNYGFTALAEIIHTRDKHLLPTKRGYIASVDESSRAMRYLLVDAAGHRRAGSLIAAMPPYGWSEFVQYRRRDGTYGLAQAMRIALRGGGQLVVASDRSVVDRMDLTLLRLFGAGFGLALLVGVITIIGLGRLIEGRLLSIENAADAIIKGNLSRRMPLDGAGGEFDRLSRTLNHMLDRIQALMDNLKQISGDIAHDLRTPLSRLRGRLEEVERMTAEPLQRERLTLAIREADDLLDLFSSILAISEIEGQSIRNRFQTVDLAEATRDIAEAFRPAFDQAGKSLTLEIAPATIFGDRQLIQRCLANLLDNVLVHTPPGTAAAIAMEKRDKGIALLIIDNGPGIPVEDRERVFRRFARLDQSRSTSGYGLGLNMVAAIAAAHDALVRILPKASGMTIEILFPAGKRRA